jgi:pyrroline-5-carboxylate reductase
MLHDKKIAIVGVGKIGGTLVSGLLRNKVVKKENLTGSTAHAESSEQIAQTLDIKMNRENAALVKGRDVIILAVKPQTLQKVLVEIKDFLTEEQLIITLAAARSTAFIEELLGKKIPVVRAMPNTPCLVNAGMTVLCPGKFAKHKHIEMARSIFEPIGLVEVIDNEELMDGVTALSGSGPAYAYIIIEALAEGGVKVGLPRHLATKLAAQTLLGGAKMVMETGEHPAKLKDEVTTPAGTTIDGIMALEDGGIRVTLIKTVDRATEKSKELSK